METIFIEYPKCTTCKRAKKFLLNNNIEFEDRHIVEENPTKEEILAWMKMSDLEIKKFFNTSGILYREMKLKEKIKDITMEEAAEILSTNGMLLKRPILIKDKNILLGYKEESYKKIL